MRLRELMKFGIPEIVIDAWIARQGDYLLPLQEKAIRAGLFEDGESRRPGNLLISAPTSSGKSFCGEMAAIAALLHRRKTILLVPLKSIAEEKQTYFQRCYGPLGIRTIIVTRDHPENDDIFRLGQFDLAVAIFEKFNRLLTANLDILRQVGLVVIDEVQMVGDAERGVELETALTKIIVSGYTPRIVALSAVLADETELSAWLKATVLKETVRPVDLLLGIAAGGYFHYRSFNSGREGKERFPATAEDGGDCRASLMRFLKADGSRKLVFLKSRQNTLDAAFQLASSVDWKEARRTLTRLEENEPSFLIRSLRQTLSRGVAFHNADLTVCQRRAIEEGFRSGEVRVIFSTPTLAMGVNLPAETVFLETMKYAPGAFGTRPQLVPIDLSEFLNITGRAGRFGADPRGRPGRAMVLAASDFEREVLWLNYIDPHPAQKVSSVLSCADLRDVVLDFAVAGPGRNTGGLRLILSQTFASRQGSLIDDKKLGTALAALNAAGLMSKSGQPTPLGVAAAECRLSAASVETYLALLDRRHPETLTGWLALALKGGQFDLSRAGLTLGDYRLRLYERTLHAKFSDYLGEIGAYVDLVIGRQRLDFRTAALLKSVFVLSDWAAAVPVEMLEQQYQLHHGQIINLAETAAWLLGSLGRLIAADDSHSLVPELLADYSFQVQFGISPKMQDIYRFFGDLLNRADYKRLADCNIFSVIALKNTPRTDLIPGIFPEKKLDRLLKKAQSIEQEDIMRNAVKSVGGSDYRPPGPFNPGFAHRPNLVELDGTYERERYLIRIDGFPIRLTGKSFKYLTKLACSRLIGDDGWIYKDDLEAGFNQARYLYRLKQEINKEGGFPWGIFENNRLGYYRLDLEPSKIRLNLENLKCHPDYELRSMAEQLTPRLAV
ncbi:MAG: DEAD/DEAH box helicase [Candidatus Zixiibacteriota bacterium]|nr:MAG: DEAD/DEAH box helicase [candidate division Zixibacteria bacterium]